MIRRLVVILLVLVGFVIHISIYFAMDEHVLMLPDVPSLHSLSERLEAPHMYLGLQNINSRKVD